MPAAARDRKSGATQVSASTITNASAGAGRPSRRGNAHARAYPFPRSARFTRSRTVEPWDRAIAAVASEQLSATTTTSNRSAG